MDTSLVFPDANDQKFYTLIKVRIKCVAGGRNFMPYKCNPYLVSCIYT